MVALALASGLVTACGAPQRTSQAEGVTSRARIAPAARARPSPDAPDAPDAPELLPNTPPGAASRPLAPALVPDPVLVVVEPVTNLARYLPRATAERVSQRIGDVVARRGFTTSWSRPRPTGSELTAARCRGFIVTAAIERLEIRRRAARARITCRVSVRVARWFGTDRGERWEPGQTAFAFGSANATTLASPRHVALGVHDCVDSALEGAVTRQVVPFLERLASADP